jgi:hypothetical protein
MRRRWCEDFIMRNRARGFAVDEIAHRSSARSAVVAEHADDQCRLRVMRLAMDVPHFFGADRENRPAENERCHFTPQCSVSIRRVRTTKKR